jgi:hypothetical protein
MWTFLLAQVAMAAERPPEIGMSLQPLVAFDLQHESDSEDTFESWTWIAAKAQQRTDNGGWFFAAHAAHNLRHGQDTEGLWRVRVGETGFKAPFGSARIRAGNLVERWGKLDLTPIVDVLNPSDLSAGPLATVEAMRLPVPMAVVQFSANRSRLELSYSPFPQADTAQLMGSDWSLIRPGMLESFAEETAGWDGESAGLLAGPADQLADALGELSPSTMRALSDAAGAMERPEDTGLNGNASARIEWEGPGVDAAVMGANLRSSVPQTALGPGLAQLLQAEQYLALTELDGLLADAPLQTQWPRTWMVGAEASTVLGPIGVRTEGAWWSNKVVQQTWLGSATTEAAAIGGGLDWAHGSSLLVTLEARWTHLLGAPEKLTLTRADTVDIGATVRSAFAADKLTAMVAGLYSPTFEEWMLRPELQWRISDPLQLGIGAVVIDGPQPPPTTLLGVMKYADGPLSLMSENDVVFASLRWIH